MNAKRNAVQILTPISWKIINPTVPDGRCVLVCDQLGLTTEAETAQQAVSTIESAMDLLFSDIEESGELEQFCKDKGLEYRPVPYDEEIVVLPRGIRLGESHALSH